MRILAALLAVAAALALSLEPAVAESCPPDRGAASSRSRRACPPPAERLRPHEPDRLRSGREPGFINLGNGTEVRIGGRVRLDADTRRR